MSWSAAVMVALCGVVRQASGCGEVQEVAILAGDILASSYSNAVADLQAGGVSTVDIPSLGGPWDVAQKVSIVPRLSDALHASAAAEAEMQDWVAAGNRMVALGGYYTWSMVAVVFGFEETTSCSGSLAAQTGACGDFCSGPATIAPDCSVLSTKVPAGAEVHYSSTDRAAVLSLPYGNGSVVYLGHKWAVDPPVGWDTLLHLALNLPCPTSSSTSTTSSTTASVTSSTSTSASSTSATSSSSSTTTSGTRTTSSSTSSTTTSSSSTSSTTTSSTRTTSTSSSSSSTTTSSSSTSSTTASTTSSTSTSATSTSTASSSTSTTSSTSSSSTSSGTKSSTTGTSTTGSTTTTSSSPSDLTGVEAQIQALLRVGDAAASFALEALKNQSNITVATTRIDGMLVTVARLESVAPANQSHVLVPVGEGATVRVPLSVVAQFADPQEGELILLVVSPDAAMWTGLKDTLDSGASIDAFLDVLSVDLRFLQQQSSGNKLSADALREPIGITMNASYGQRVACATVDEETSVWGTDGLEARKNEDGSVLCETTHLSIFSAILQGFLATLECSQLVLLNAEAIKHISMGRWYTEIGAVALWIILGSMAALFVLGVFLDCRRDKNRKWSSEFLLVPIHTGAAAEAIKEEKAKQDKAEEEEAGDPSLSCLEAAICAVAGFFMGCLGFCQASSAARDAFDDVMSNWFECFGDVRGMLESICDGMELSAMNSGRIFALSRRVMSHMLLRSARRLTGASMAVSDDVVVFVIEDEDLHDYLVEFLADSEVWKTQVGTPKTPASTLDDGPQHNQSLNKVDTPKTSASMLGGGSNSSRTLDKVLPDWRDSDNPREAWYLLFQAVSKNIHGHINRHSTCTIPRIMFELYLVQNPLFAVFVFDIFMTCKMRVFLLCVDIMGVLLMSCVLAEASGGAKRAPKAGEDDKCGDIPGDIGFRIGRLIAIALISIIFAGIPTSILGSFHTRSFKKLDYRGSPAWKKQLKAWAIQDRAVWILGTLYMAFCLFFVMLFLSNVSSQTHKEWADGLGIIFFEDLFLLPLILALIVPGLGVLLLGCNTICHKVPRVQLIRGIQEQLHDSTNVMLPITRL